MGSSPHTRGALGVHLLVEAARWDHPRIRGEHSTTLWLYRAAFRIIPAYAGSTVEPDTYDEDQEGSSPHTRGAPYPSASIHWPHQDHPRIRGEHHYGLEFGNEYVRIIPAYAGSTASPSARPMSREGSSPHTRGAPNAAHGKPSGLRDHPRIRGEHSLPYRHPTRLSGIIPAYAGSTFETTTPARASAGSSPHTRGAPRTVTSAARAPADHPRIRGEHDTCARARRLREGSSPHTRGAPRTRPPSTWWAKDHPRIRGEHLLLPRESVRQLGIIPAYAGSTTIAIITRTRRQGSSPHTRGALT